MKLHILSDLHFEYGAWPPQVVVNEIDADVTILTGDLGGGLQGIAWALSIARPVIYVMGNLDVYGQSSMEELWHEARNAAKHSHVHLLENAAVLIDDPRTPGEHVRFLGTTLWTDFCALGADLQQHCMDS